MLGALSQQRAIQVFVIKMQSFIAESQVSHLKTVCGTTQHGDIQDNGCSHQENLWQRIKGSFRKIIIHLKLSL
jgi:hypothetical protein